MVRGSCVSVPEKRVCNEDVRNGWLIFDRNEPSVVSEPTVAASLIVTLHPYNPCEVIEHHGFRATASFRFNVLEVPDDGKPDHKDGESRYQLRVQAS